MPLYNSEEIKVGELDIVVSLLDHGPYYRIKQNVSGMYLFILCHFYLFFINSFYKFLLILYKL